MEMEALEQNAEPNAVPPNEGDQAATAESHDREGSMAEMTGWPRLHYIDRVAVLMTLAVIVVITIPRLPAGICFHDSGELQLCSTVLGITHAPGYPGFVSLGYLATLFPGVDPAYMVTLAYTFAGFVMIWLCIMMQVRLGANALIACGVALAFVAVPRVWDNLITPEVYIPSLTFSAAAAYILFRYHRLGRRRDLYIAAFLFGIALANRPPILFSLPFFILGWWLARKHWDTSVRQSIRAFLVVLGCAIVPLVYSLIYIYVRDTTETPYNYLENIYYESEQIPPLTDGWRAKVDRVIYHTTGKEFSYAMGNSPDRVWQKTMWLYKEFFMYRPVRFCLVMFAVIGGILLAFRRCAAASWVLIGLALASVVFILAYDMHGQAADYMPLVWVAYIFGGLSLTWILKWLRDRPRQLIATGFAAAVGTFVVLEVDSWPGPGLGDDAVPYVQAFNMTSLPENAVVCTKWPEIPPLFYAKIVLTGRDDIKLIPAHDKHWIRLMEPIKNRPIFVTRNSRPVRDLTLTPWRFQRPLRRVQKTRDAGRTGTLIWRVERDE
jgi:hypothetical protein